MPSILNLFSQLCFPLAAFGVPSIGFHVGISPLSAASWQTLKTWEWFRARISIGQAAASTGTMRGEAGLPLVQAAKTSHPSWGPQTLTAGLRTDYGMLPAAACVDESDHHALMYVLGGGRRRGRRWRVFLRGRYRYRTDAGTQGAREQY
jgi:hypothetical protein